MATYKRFEDTPAWQLAQDYAFAIFQVTGESCFKFRGDLVNQLRRAALSISNNIAEGFARGTTRDFINYLYISRGSCAETRSMLHFALKFSDMSVCEAELRRLLDDADRLGRQIWGWIDALQNSAIEGMRSLTDEQRKAWKKDTAEAKAPQRMTDWEFNQLANEIGIAEATKMRNEALSAWLHYQDKVQEDREAEAKESGAPTCDRCGKVMVVKRSKAGAKFWACPNYPHCRQTKNYVR